MFGLESVGELLGHPMDEWLKLVAMATTGLTCAMAALQNNICKFIITTSDDYIRALRAVISNVPPASRSMLKKAVAVNARTPLRERVKALLVIKKAVEETDGDTELPLPDLSFQSSSYNNPLKHYHGRKKELLNAMCDILTKNAEASRSTALHRDPWKLMACMSADSFETKFGSSFLFQASDEGAIRYDGSGTVSFGSPMLAQYVFDLAGNFPK